MSLCSKCGKDSEEHMISIIEVGINNEQDRAAYKDYCFDCAIGELKKRWRWIPITIEVPHVLTGDTNEEISSGGAAINYVAELVDFPTDASRRAAKSKDVHVRMGEIREELTELQHREEVIRARYTKEIWSDEAKYPKERLRQAELTLRVEDDPEYQAIKQRRNTLRLEEASLRREYFSSFGGT